MRAGPATNGNAMAGIGSLLGEGSTASQFLLWGIAYGVAQALLEPEYTAIGQTIWRNQAVKVLDPAILADQVVRGIRDQSSGENEAADSGIDTDRFDTMVRGAGEPPGLQFMLEAYRRGYIQLGAITDDNPSLLGGIAKSRLYTQWAGVVEQMASVPISPADAVDAVLRGQIPRPQGESEAYASGVDADRFAILYNTAGRPPAPGELVEFVRRGLIPFKGTGPDALTFEQGIFEGDEKDKWEPLYEKLVDYIPPPRSIATLQSHGVIDTATAAGLYREAGLSPELAGIYAASAVAVKVAQHKLLAESAVLKLYADKLMDGPAAAAALGDLGYDPPEAAFLLETQDFAVAARSYDTAVSRVGALYSGHKINRQAALDALARLDVPGPAQAKLMADWDLELAANVRTLTPAQVASAFYYGALDQPTAMAMLVREGYTPFDAWVVLVDRSHGLLPDQPPPDVGSGLGIPETAG